MMQLLQESEKLKWAAIQLLQSYARCGVGMVPRGSSRLVDAWAENGPIEDVQGNRTEPTRPSTSKSEVALQVSTIPMNTRSPLPPMPVVPLRSSTQEAKLPPSPPTIASPGSLEIGEKQWLGPALSEPERAELFAILREQVAACHKCEELACSRKQTVFGVGSTTPRVVFFGEAPGADEDKKGEPFVGAAGQLLDKIINASRMRRDEVYILNSLKCRPPGNRTPFELEIENCRPFFEAQLDVLQPQFIVCLGAVAVRAVLQTTESVGRLRGRFHRYRNAQVLVTYHPAYLLRNESAKKHVWEDMKLLMRAMGIQVPNA